MTYTELQKAIASAHRRGDFRLAYELETEAQWRRNAARDRWIEEAAIKKGQQSDRRKYGSFYRIEKGRY